MVGFLAQVENNSMEIEMNNNSVNNNNNNNIENEGASNSMDTELNNNSSNNSDSSRIETNGSPNNNSSINVDLKRYFLTGPALLPVSPSRSYRVLLDSNGAHYSRKRVSNCLARNAQRNSSSTRLSGLGERCQ